MTFHRLILAAILLVLVVTAVPPTRQLAVQRQRIEAERQKLEWLHQENARLAITLERLRDPDHLEILAREQLGLVRPGEIAYLMVAPEEAEEKVEAPAAAARPWHSRLWQWLRSLVK